MNERERYPTATRPCRTCSHPEVRHTAAGTACYVEACTCDRYTPPPDPFLDALTAAIEPRA